MADLAHGFRQPFRVLEPSLGSRGKRWWVGGALSACVVVGAILRFGGLGDVSLWSDELFSKFYFRSFGLHYLLHGGLLNEPTPPTYYILLQSWMALFGSSPTGIRSLSAAASVLSIPLAYLLGKELSADEYRAEANVRAGLVSALLMAVSPIAIVFAQQARVYSLTELAAGVAMLGLARYLRSGTKGDLSIYIAAAVVGAYLHITLVFFAGACFLAVSAALMLNGTLRRQWLAWSLANLIIAAMIAPELVVMLAIGRSGTGIGWIEPFHAGVLVATVAGLVSGARTPVALPGIELTLATLVLLASAIRTFPARALAVTVAIPAVAYCLLVGASLERPILLARLLDWMSLPLSVALALAMIRQRRPLLVIVAVVTLITGNYYAHAPAFKVQEAWRPLFARIGPALQRADLVVLAPDTTPFVLTQYAPGLHRVSYLLDPTESGMDVLVPQQLGLDMTTQARVASEIMKGKRVWVIGVSLAQSFIERLERVAPAGTHVNELCRGHVCALAAGWNVEQQSD